MSNHCSNATMIRHHEQVNGGKVRRENKRSAQLDNYVRNSRVLYKRYADKCLEETFIGIWAFSVIMVIQVWAYYYIL